MNKTITYILFLVLFCMQTTVDAQEKKHLGYTIEGDEVVFTFDVRDYKKATKDNSGKRLNFSDLDIYSVAVSGEFNNWSREQWKMNKTGTYTYELRKKLSDLNSSVSQEFKFIVNEKYWAEPGKNIPNTTKAKKDDFWLNVYNLKLYTATPDENGNIRFYLKGFPNAKKVILCGTFNQWNEEEFKMKRARTGWELPLQMSPGYYEYKFIVDGKWMHDPDNPEKRLNRFLTYNSLLTITKPVSFTLKGFEDARKIVLSGSFNNWNTKSVVMTRNADGWSTTIDLKGGKIHYKYIVDGKWITDPGNPVKEYDEHGYINSVKIVE